MTILFQEKEEALDEKEKENQEKLMKKDEKIQKKLEEMQRLEELGHQRSINDRLSICITFFVVK